MIPIRDDQKRSTTAWVTYSIIAVNVLVYAYEFHLQVPDLEAFRELINYNYWNVGPQPDPRALNALIAQFGLIPHHLQMATASSQIPIAGVLFSFVSSMFLHASIFHLLGNMWFLWIFGDNIEDHLGHGIFAIFYFLCGLAAAGAYVLAVPVSDTPVIGASGAIAGVMGAFLVRYPNAKLQVYVGFMGVRGTTWIPGFVALGYWFALQVIGQHFAETGISTSNVAYVAHIVGFVLGMVMIRIIPGRSGYDYGGWVKKEEPVVPKN